MNDIRVRVLATAREDIRNIFLFYSDHSSVTAARVLSDIDDLFDQLCLFPDSGRLSVKGTRHRVTSRYRYSVVYSHSGDVVNIIAVFREQDRLP